MSDAAEAEMRQRVAQFEAAAEAAAEAPRTTPSCTDCFSKWRYCSSPAHQMKQYYVYGEIDPCEIEWDDLMLCLKTKLKKPEESEAIWKAREAEKAALRPEVTTLDVVWEKREAPPPAALRKRPAPAPPPGDTSDRPMAAEGQ